MEMTIGANIKRLSTAKNITQGAALCGNERHVRRSEQVGRGETYPDITSSAVGVFL